MSDTDRLTVRVVARLIRFQHNTEIGSACWIWTGPTNSKGSPIACVGGQVESARRAVYRSYRGRNNLPEGQLFVRCQKQLCVNPAHVSKHRSPRRQLANV